jgi:hypothetical protein
MSYDVKCPLKVESNPLPISSDDFKSYLNHDYDLILNNDLWKSYRNDNVTNDHCYIYIDKKNNDPVWWIKVVADVDGDIGNIDDLLDKSLKERQHEWHVLFRGGYSIWKESSNNNLYEICYYRYASTLFGVSPRDTCYMKLRRNLYCDENGVTIIKQQLHENNNNNIINTDDDKSDGNQQSKRSTYYYGFILSYRSIDLPELAPVAKNYVRTKFSGAHLITLKDFKDPSKGFIYTYIQHAHPGGQ